MTCCVCAGTLGVPEHESRVEAHFAHKRQRGMVVGLRLAVKAAEQVCADGASGDDSADGLHAVEIPLASVFAVHQLQDAVAARLYRQVNGTAQVGVRSYHLQSAVVHVFGVGGGKADAQAGRGFGHDGQQVGEAHRMSALLLETVGIDVLPQQSHFLIAFCPKVMQLAHDAFRVATPLTPSCVGYNAVGAEIVTPSRDGYVTANGLAYAGGHHIAVSLRGRQLHVDSSLALFGSSHQVRQIEVGIRTGHQVDPMVSEQLFFEPFGHAADNPDDQLTVFPL